MEVGALTTIVDSTKQMQWLCSPLLWLYTYRSYLIYTISPVEHEERLAFRLAHAAHPQNTRVAQPYHDLCLSLQVVQGKLVRVRLRSFVRLRVRLSIYI